jgi:tetratricopeptide (TPR) repeat protein
MNDYRTAALFPLLVLSACLGPAGPRIDNLPMYGQPEIARPEWLKQADERFIRDATAASGSREKASREWWHEGERFMAQRDLDHAMRRYNQAWLLDPDAYGPYWGFGRVMLQQGNLEQGSIHLEKAASLVDDAYQKPALLTDLANAYAIRARALAEVDAQERARLFALANQRYAEAAAVDPGYEHVWRRWAACLYEQGRYAEAWAKVREALEHDAPVAPEFLEKLRQTFPEPE